MIVSTNTIPTLSQLGSHNLFRSFLFAEISRTLYRCLCREESQLSFFLGSQFYTLCFRIKTPKG